MIKIQPTEKGFCYVIHDQDGNRIPIDHWMEAHQFLSKADSIVLQTMNQLLDEELADKLDDSIIIPHTTIADLLDEERTALYLPSPFPFEIEIRSFGNLAHKNFRYIYRFLNGSSQPFVNPKHIGSYLEITTEQTYLLAGDQYRLIEAMDKFNNRKTENQTIKNNLLEFSKIKGLAHETGATLDIYLRSEQVVSSSRLSLRLKRIDNNTIEIEPVICDEDHDNDGNPINKPILNEADSIAFLDVFDNLKERELYSIPNGPKIVFNEKQKEVLGKVKKFRKVSGKQKEVLLQTPQALFDPDIVDFEHPLIDGNVSLTWSERIIKIDEYKPRIIPFMRPGKEPWLPPEGMGIVFDGDMIYVSFEDASDLKKQVENAIKDGRKEVSWKNKTIQASDEAVEAINHLIKIRPSKETTTEEAIKTEKREQEVRRTPNILIIKDDIDELNYEIGREVRPGKHRIPKCVKAGIKLFPHQKEGLHWLQGLWLNGRKGALLADDMGLGKTLQALAFMGWVRELMDEKSIKKKPMLVVAPVTLLENWKEEYFSFLEPIFGPFLELHGAGIQKYKDKNMADKLNISREIEIKERDDAEKIICSGRGLLLDYKKIKNAGAVLTTYESVRDYQFSLSLIDWGVMVLDETQKIKTPTAMVTTAVKAMKYEFGISLTGTPVENSWVDLWSIMDFIQPGHLGSLKDFIKQFQNPLRKEETDREALGKSLKNKVDPLLKRRMKEDHLDGLPDKTIKSYEVQMPEIQLNQYMEIIRKAKVTLSGKIGGKRKYHIFNTLAALKDISLHPYMHMFSTQGMAEFSDNEIIKSSARLLKTFEILKMIKNQGEKVILFLISRSMQTILQRLIWNQFNIRSSIIDGKMPGAKRQTTVDAFQNTTGFNAIIISPLAAGVGLNITAANHVIHLSRHWNPAKEDQANDRVYRIGQEKPVTIHIPLAVHSVFDTEDCKGTFDQKLHRLLTHKRQLYASVLAPNIIEEDELENMWDEIFESPEDESDKPKLSITDVDRLSPDVFELLITVIYRKRGYQAELTPRSCDQGADVVALAHGNKGSSFLAQCKHSINPNKAQGANGVQEILAAYGVYKKNYRVEFEKVVYTNSERYTSQTVQIASDNGVILKCRKDISKLIKECNITIGDLV